MARAVAVEEFSEFLRVRRERDDLLRGLRHLREIRERASSDPDRAQEEAYELVLFGHADVVPDENGRVPGAERIVYDYYSGLISAYEQNARRALTQTNTWALSLASRPVRTRPRAREARPRRQRVRSSSAASRDGPDDDPDEPPGVEPRQAKHSAWRLGVEVAA